MYPTLQVLLTAETCFFLLNETCPKFFSLKILFQLFLYGKRFHILASQ